MDIQRYSELKASGDLLVKEIEGEVRIVKKSYDPDTGKSKGVAILPIDKESFIKHKKNAQEMIDAITVFLDDVEAAENQ